MKSTLKTFLAGKNPFYLSKLFGSTVLSVAVNDMTLDSYFECPYTNLPWVIDVLDDGTAITYQLTDVLKENHGKAK
jgi:hypothetical protein